MNIPPIPLRPSASLCILDSSRRPPTVSQHPISSRNVVRSSLYSPIWFRYRIYTGLLVSHQSTNAAPSLCAVDALGEGWWICNIADAIAPSVNLGPLEHQIRGMLLPTGIHPTFGSKVRGSLDRSLRNQQTTRNYPPFLLQPRLFARSAFARRYDGITFHRSVSD